METLTRVVMSKPGVKGLLVCLNISSNTQIDVAARGIVKVLKELRVDPSKFPVVIRLAGLNDRAAKELIEQSGYEYHGEDITMDEASALIVQRVRELEA
jgi:succinyl-CoA synthetase beta subunit/citryl-CoA synthetase large subunit